jgi:hypothetical protein
LAPAPEPGAIDVRALGSGCFGGRAVGGSEVRTPSQRFVKRETAQDRSKLVSVPDRTVFRAKPDDRPLALGRGPAALSNSCSSARLTLTLVAISPLL